MSTTRAGFLALWVAVFFLATGCGESKNFDFDYTQAQSQFGQGESSASSGSQSQSDAGTEYFGFAECLSKVEVLHSTFSADPSRYELEFACLRAKGKSIAEVSQAITAQATQDLCPRSFTFVERVNLGATFSLRIVARHPTGPVSSSNSFKQHQASVARSACHPDLRSYTKEVGQNGFPSWTDVESPPNQ